MRIIKRGRRHIVISPSGLPVEEAAAKPATDANRTLRPLVRFDQLPVDLQRALTQPRSTAQGLRAK